MRQLKRMARTVVTSVKSLGEWSSLRGLRAARPRSPRYWLYLLQQSEKSRRYANRPNHRAEALVDRAMSFPTVSSLAETPGAAVLCVGCRNAQELDAFEQAGFARVLGVDLFSVDPRIRVMDMHDLDFESESFDLVYSCHSLEHSFDPSRATREMLRVSRPGAAFVIEVPVDFPVSITDRQDYGSARGVRSLFNPQVGQVLVEEEVAHPDGSRIARVVFHTRGEPAT
jgi:SAM-dependent methyltransferase